MLEEEPRISCTIPRVLPGKKTAAGLISPGTHGVPSPGRGMGNSPRAQFFCSSKTMAEAEREKERERERGREEETESGN